MYEDAQKLKHAKMTQTPIKKLICIMAVPAITSQLISSLYNMVDTMFVGKISTSATAAVGVIFSYMALIQAFGFFLGQGSSNYISRRLGARDVEGATRMAATGFFSALFCGLVIMILGLIFTDPLLHLLGATPSIMTQSREYLTFILIGSPYMMATFVLNNQMRMQGNALLGMIGISTGAVLNIGLDPLLMFGFGLGVKGAALATILSQLISFILMLYLCDKRGGVGIHWKKFAPSIAYYKEIVSAGLPSLFRQGLSSIAAVCLNHLAGLYGDSAIAAFSVVNRIVMFSNSALLGFGQGFQPVCGFNFGAGLYSRVKKAFWFCVKAATVFYTVLGIIGYIFAPEIIRLFRAEDAELIVIGARALRNQCFIFPLLPLIIIDNMFLQNIRKTTSASFLALARQGLFFLPIVYLAVHLFGLSGLQAAQPVSDLLTFCTSLPLGILALRALPKKDTGILSTQ
jgi:putative MATE family efflux protein